MNLQSKTKWFFLMGLIGCLSCYAAGQTSEPLFIETQAVITMLESRISGRTSTVTATVSYVTESGDSLKSQTRLLHIPILGSFKEVGDTITVVYQKENPYVIMTKEESFLQTYGFYVLIGFGIVISGYRLIRRKSKS